MEDGFLIALIGALGIKQIWDIVKQKIDLKAKKEERGDGMISAHVDTLSKKIEQLETKIDELIEENINLKVKIARMEERILKNAKNRVKKT
tara:strand:- start:1060 stop:1332 length:273 start_codon:yes stop_codon:yes gene_type:complete